MGALNAAGPANCMSFSKRGMDKYDSSIQLQFRLRSSKFHSHFKAACMKKLFSAFDLFGGGKVYEPSVPSESPVTVTSFSQPHVLQTRMKEEKLSHGGTVKASLSPVRLDMDHDGVVMYFCPMQSVQVLEVIAEGDGGNIPAQARIEGLSIPAGYKSGLYELENIELTSNGTILVKATEKTRWNLIERAVPID